MYDRLHSYIHGYSTHPLCYMFMTMDSNVKYMFGVYGQKFFKK